MSISVECSACQKKLKVKDELAGRKVRCPGCQETLAVPSPEDDGTDGVDDDLKHPTEKPLARHSKTGGRKLTKPSARSASPLKSLQHWHWLAVLTVMLLALIPTIGLRIAGLVAFAGICMTLIGGIFPFLRIIFGAPGTVLQMIFSRSARFEMMEQPDDHPYKVLVRSAFRPTRGLFWRGVLFVVTFIPAAFLNSAAEEWLRSRQSDQVALSPPRQLGAAGSAAHSRPVQANIPHGRPIGPEPGLPPFGPANRVAATDDARITYVTIEYKELVPPDDPTEKIRSFITELPGYVEGSLQINLDAKTLSFQQRGRELPKALGLRLSRLGMKSLTFHAGTRPPS